MLTAEPVCSWAHYPCATCLRDRGCSAHPVFPAPSYFQRASEMQNFGQNMPREREVMPISISRHCERSEAIHVTTLRKNGLLRCARNDEDRPALIPDERDDDAPGRISAHRSAPANPALPNFYWTPPANRGTATGIRFEGRLVQPAEGIPAGQNVALLQCSKTIKAAPAKGQWQSGRLLCIGAAGNTRFGTGLIWGPAKTAREETCVH